MLSIDRNRGHQKATRTLGEANGRSAGREQEADRATAKGPRASGRAAATALLLQQGQGPPNCQFGVFLVDLCKRVKQLFVMF